MEQEKQGTVIAIRQPNPNFLVMGLPAIQDLAKVFIDSGIFADTKDQAQAIVKILAGQEVSLMPFYSMNNFYLVESWDTSKKKYVTKIGQSAQSMLALLVRDGDFRYTIQEDSAERCVIEFEQLFKEGWKIVYTGTFTIEDAEQAGLLHRWDAELKKRVLKTGTWAKWTKDMLFSRCASRGSRRIGSHKLGGARYTPEELSSGVLADPDTISAETLLEKAVAPTPEGEAVKDVKKINKRKSRKVQEDTSKVSEKTPKEGEVEELTGDDEREANELFDNLATNVADVEVVDTGTGEITEASKEETPAETEEPEPVCPPSPDNIIEILRSAYNTFKMQPDVVYKALEVSGSVGMEKKYTVATAWEKIWRYHLAKLEEGK